MTLTRASSLSSLLTTPSTKTTTTATAILPPDHHDLNHASVQPAIQAVLDSWKHCRNSFIIQEQEHEFDETFGKLLLIRLFDLEPRLKLLFGFHMNIDPTATPLGEMALILRAVRLTHQLNQVLEMLEHDHNALNLLLVELSRQRKDYLIKRRDIPLMGQALMHAVSTIMTSEDDGDDNKSKSVVWDDNLMLAWQQVIDAISFQILGGNANSSTASTTSSTRRTRTSGGNPNVVKNINTEESSTCRPRRLKPSSSMPLRRPLRQPSLPQAQGLLPDNAMNETDVVVTREMVPCRMPLSPSRSFRNKKSSSRHHRRHHYVSTLPKAAQVLVTKTTTTTTTTYHTTTTTIMSDSASIMSAEYDQDESKRFNKNKNNNSFVGNSNNNDKKSASFEAMNYTTTTMDSEGRHHISSSLQASMGNYSTDNMGRLSSTSRQCNFNMTRSSSCTDKFTVIPQAYFVVFPPLENDDSSCSTRSFGAIKAVPETLLMHHASSLLLPPQTQHSDHHYHHHHLPTSSHSFNIGSSRNNNSATSISRDRRLLTRGGSMMMKKQSPPFRVASARKLYITS